MRLAMATGRADRVVGLHFFNPVPVLPLVEIVSSLHTTRETTERVEAFARDTLGKTAVHSQDRAGFVVNALLVPYLLSAIRMAESGFATAADVDAGMELGCAHPMGPLKLADLIGLDTVAAIAQSLYEEFKEPLYAPPRCSSGWSRQGCWAARAAAGSTRTTGADGERPAVSHVTVRDASRCTHPPGPAPTLTRSSWFAPVRQAGCVVRGNPVGIRDCPAAVSGNDRRHTHWARTGLGSDGQ